MVFTLAALGTQDASDKLSSSAAKKKNHQSGNVKLIFLFL